LSFLWRWKYSECGFIGYNLKHWAIEQFLDDFRSLYVTDSIFKKREYHDAYLFDCLRRKYERAGALTFDITEGVVPDSGDAVVCSVLGRYMRHLKGDRKRVPLERQNREVTLQI
jgi:hypothetical protein